MLTKKRLVLLTILLTAIYYGPLLYWAVKVQDIYIDSTIMLAAKIGFLSVSAAITTSVVLIFIFKRDYIKAQWITFNRYRYLLLFMVKRDFLTRYRKNVLGILWSLLNPLLTMLVMTMVFSLLFRFKIENYPVYFLSGLIMYSFFNEATSMAMTSIISGENIIKKVYVPKYIFPLSKVSSALTNLMFSFAAFLLVCIITGAPLRWTMLLTPIPIIYIFVFALGVAMLMSALAVFFRDIMHMYSVCLVLLMYLTPIIYPIDILPERVKPFIGINPLYHFVECFRDFVLRGIIPDIWSNVVCIGFGMAALCCGVYVFMLKQDRFI